MNASETLAEPELIEPVVGNPEVVAELVYYCLADLLADLVIVAADGLDGLLVDADLVREDEVVVLAALGQRDAMVEAEERAACPEAGDFAVARGRATLDDDLHVLNPLEEVAWEGGDGLADQPAEALAFQGPTSALRRRPRGCGNCAR